MSGPDNLHKDLPSIKTSEEVLTDVGGVEGSWESESEAEQPYVTS